MPQLTDDCSLIRVEKLLLTNGLDDAISAAFGEHETRDLQFGLDWLINLATTALDADEEAVIFVARRSAADFIACPMKLGAHRAYAHALSTFYTTTYSPIVASTAPDARFLALFEHLARVERIATLMLYPLAADSTVSAVVRDALNHAGWRGAHDFFCFGNWIHDLEGSSFQSYLAARPSQLRNTVARKTRQFLAAGRGRLELVTGGDALETERTISGLHPAAAATVSPSRLAASRNSQLRPRARGKPGVAGQCGYGLHLQTRLPPGLRPALSRHCAHGLPDGTRHRQGSRNSHRLFVG